MLAPSVTNAGHVAGARFTEGEFRWIAVDDAPGELLDRCRFRGDDVQRHAVNFRSTGKVERRCDIGCIGELAALGGGIGTPYLMLASAR